MKKNVISVDEMFEKIKNEKGFTVEGYKVTIKRKMIQKFYMF